MTQDVINIASALTERQSSSWRVSAMRVDRREALDTVFFLDATHGWVGGEGALYKTADGGRTWQRIRLDVPPHAEVVDIFFTNPSLGWVAMQKRAPDLTAYRENQLWLIQTRDGGQTWRLQHEDRDAVVTHISFVDEQKGWLTGIRYIGLRPLRSIFLMLYTSDRGQHWTDVSGDLNRIATNDQGFVNGWITGIIPEGSLTATVLTVRGQIFKTANGGQTWQQAEALRGEPPQTCICHFGIKGNRHLWVAGGADSIEGIWGMLALEQSNNSWVKYRLNGVYFADVLLLSEKQILACGSIPANEEASDHGRRRNGVILYSSDGGHSWSIIYHNTQVKTINALAAVDSEHIAAVGEEGLIVRLESSREKASTFINK